MTSSHSEKQNSSQPPTIIQDERFNKLHFDPRFQKIPKTRRKLKIDQRFKRMFTDRSFSDTIVEKDKYGRHVTRMKPGENMKQFYELCDSDEEENNSNVVVENEELFSSSGNENHQKTITNETSPNNNTSTSEQNTKEVNTGRTSQMKQNIPTEFGEKSDLPPNTKTTLTQLPNEKVKTLSSVQNEESIESVRENDVSSTSSTTTTSSEESSEAESLDEETSEDDNTFDLVPKEEIPIGTETAQLAVLGCDWEHVKAVDLYMVFQSFLPPRGTLRSVAVYPSDFGLRMMIQERVKGPDVWDASKESEVDTLSLRKLRAYERMRLRYFFAIVRCDSPQTALALYQQLDGYELEHSSNCLDLRFVDDETLQHFTDQHVISLTLETDLNALLTQRPRPCVSVCTPETVPVNYQSAPWVTRALQMTNVTLTWDQTDPSRTRILQRNLSAIKSDEPLRESDYRAYLASSHSSDTLSSSESLSDASHSDSEVLSPELILQRIRQKREKRKAKRAKIRERYAPLLSGLYHNENSSQNETTEGEMEVTFTTGLSQRAERLIEAKMKERQKTDENKTVWEKVLEKRKEKKRQKRLEKRKKERESQKNENTQRAEVLPIDPNDPFANFEEAFKVPPRKKRKKGTVTSEEEARQIAELELLVDSKSKEKFPTTESTSSSLKLQDERFRRLLTDPRFALDPTHPQFAKVRHTAKIINSHKASLLSNDSSQEGDETKYTSVSSQSPQTSITSSHSKHELSVLVASVKRKAQQQQQQQQPPSDTLVTSSQTKKRKQ